MSAPKPPSPSPPPSPPSPPSSPPSSPSSPCAPRAGQAQDRRPAAWRLALALAAMLGPSAPPPARAEPPPLRLAAPAALIEMGLLKHLLPRFRFKTRIRVIASPAPENPDLSLTPAGAAPGAPPVLRRREGETFALILLADDPARRARAARLTAWLRSGSGRRAIEGFKLDGRQAFAPANAIVAPPKPVPVTGDAMAGSRLALVHCGRCHVIDQRNRHGGIGSTPSFAAVRALPEWRLRFAGFHTVNPHPSFTRIEGVSDPFDPARPPHIAPVILTQEEADAIAAYAATIEPKDLGLSDIAR